MVFVKIIESTGSRVFIGKNFINCKNKKKLPETHQVIYYAERDAQSRKHSQQD